MLPASGFFLAFWRFEIDPGLYCELVFDIVKALGFLDADGKAAEFYCLCVP